MDRCTGGDRRGDRPVSRVRTRRHVRAVRPNLLTRHIHGLARHSPMRRCQTLVARPATRMGPDRRARRSPPRLHGAHRKRPRDRHGHVRRRLSARALDVRSRSLRSAGPPLGRLRSGVLRTQRHAAIPRPLHVPVPGYRHDAAMFLELRGWAESDNVPVDAPRRPESDRDVLLDIGERLGVL